MLLAATACVPVSPSNGKAGADSAARADNQGVILSPDGGQTQQAGIDDDFRSVKSLVVRFDSTNLRPATSHSREIAAFSVCDRTAGGQLVSIDQGGRALLWDLAHDRSFELLRLPFEPSKVQISPGCRYVAAAQGHALHVVEIATAREVAVFSRLKPRVTALTWAVDEESLLFGVSDGVIYRWHFLRPDSGPQNPSLERYSGHASVVSALAAHPGGRVFFSADWDGGLSGWLKFDADLYGGAWDKNIFGEEFFSEKTSRQKAGRGGPYVDFLISGTNRIVAGTQSGAIELWGTRGLRNNDSVQAHSGMLYDLALSPDESLVASASRDGKVKVFRIISEDNENGGKNLKLKPVQQLPMQGAKAIAFFDSRTLYVGGANGRIAVVTINEGLQNE